MNIIENVETAVKLLNEVEEYGATLYDKLSVLDSKEQDLLHYIENNKINVLWCFKMVREIKNIRLERRKVKNDMELIYKFNESKNKLASKDNRPFVVTELHKRANLFDAPYKNRQYTEEELHNILGGK